MKIKYGCHSLVDQSVCRDRQLLPHLLISWEYEPLSSLGLSPNAQVLSSLTRTLIGASQQSFSSFKCTPPRGPWGIHMHHNSELQFVLTFGLHPTAKVFSMNTVHLIESEVEPYRTSALPRACQSNPMVLSVSNNWLPWRPWTLPASQPAS